MVKYPFWIINKKTFITLQGQEYEDHWSLWKLIRIWIQLQWFYFRSLYFKKCKENYITIGTGHFLNPDMYCIRCKKSVRQIDLEKRLRKIKK